MAFYHPSLNFGIQSNNLYKLQSDLNNNEMNSVDELFKAVDIEEFSNIKYHNQLQQQIQLMLIHNHPELIKFIDYCLFPENITLQQPLQLFQKYSSITVRLIESFKSYDSCTLANYLVGQIDQDIIDAVILLKNETQQILEDQDTDHEQQILKKNLQKSKSQNSSSDKEQNKEEEQNENEKNKNKIFDLNTNEELIEKNNNDFSIDIEQNIEKYNNEKQENNTNNNKRINKFDIKFKSDEQTNQVKEQLLSEGFKALNHIFKFIQKVFEFTDFSLQSKKKSSSVVHTLNDIESQCFNFYKLMELFDNIFILIHDKEMILFQKQQQIVNWKFIIDQMLDLSQFQGFRLVLLQIVQKESLRYQTKNDMSLENIDKISKEQQNYLINQITEKLQFYKKQNFDIELYSTDYKSKIQGVISFLIMWQEPQSDLIYIKQNQQVVNLIIELLEFSSKNKKNSLTLLLLQYVQKLIHNLNSENQNLSVNQCHKIFLILQQIIKGNYCKIKKHPVTQQENLGEIRILCLNIINTFISKIKDYNLILNDDEDDKENQEQLNDKQEDEEEEQETAEHIINNNNNNQQQEDIQNLQQLNQIQQNKIQFQKDFMHKLVLQFFFETDVFIQDLQSILLKYPKNDVAGNYIFEIFNNIIISINDKIFKAIHLQQVEFIKSVINDFNLNSPEQYKKIQSTKQFIKDHQQNTPNLIYLLERLYLNIKHSYKSQELIEDCISESQSFKVFNDFFYDKIQKQNSKLGDFPDEEYTKKINQQKETKIISEKQLKEKTQLFIQLRTEGGNCINRCDNKFCCKNPECDKLSIFEAQQEVQRLSRFNKNMFKDVKQCIMIEESIDEENRFLKFDNNNITTINNNNIKQQQQNQIKQENNIQIQQEEENNNNTSNNSNNNNNNGESVELNDSIELINKNSLQGSQDLIQNQSEDFKGSQSIEMDQSQDMMGSSGGGDDKSNNSSSGKLHNSFLQSQKLVFNEGQLQEQISINGLNLGSPQIRPNTINNNNSNNNSAKKVCQMSLSGNNNIIIVGTDKEKWSCKACQLGNKKEDSKCERCGEQQQKKQQMEGGGEQQQIQKIENNNNNNQESNQEDDDDLL